MPEAGAFLLANIDAIAAGLLAALVILGAATGRLEEDRLAEANVAVVLAVALVILRDRWERRHAITGLQLGVSRERKAATDEMRDAMRTERERCVAGVEHALEELHATKAWTILDEEMTWDLVASDGSRAKAVAHKVFLFNQNEVFCIYEYQLPTVARTEITEHSCFGGEQEPLTRLPIIQSDFPSPTGHTYRLISLQRVWRRGEVMRFRSERHLANAFLLASEHVSKEISSPTSHITLQLTWPSGRPPTSVHVERTDRKREAISVDTLTVIDGRQQLRKTITDPVMGETIIVAWTW
jgi:hypothetical protein